MNRSSSRWIRLVLALALVPCGCARLQTFRSPDPALMSQRADSADSLASSPHAPGRDSYADWLEGRSEAEPVAGTIVRNTRPSPARAASAVGDEETGARSTELVSLGPPIPLRGGPDTLAAPAPPILEPVNPAEPDPITTVAGNIEPGPASLAPEAVRTPLASLGSDPRASTGSSVHAVSTRSPATAPVNPPASPLPADVPEAISNDPLAGFRQAVAAARARIDSMTSYQVLMNRQERVGDTLQAAEDVILCLRRTPRAVRLEWPDGPTKGREVLYMEGGPMHIKMPNNPLMPRMTLPANSPLASRNSRHPISEAGLENIVVGLENTLARHDAGQNVGQLAYAGIESPAANDPPCHKLVQTNPAGETWIVYVDQQSALPFMIQGTDAQGQLLERYVFRDLRPNLPDLAENAAFDPNARWGAPSGLLGRLAGAAAGQADSPPAPDPDSSTLR